MEEQPRKKKKDPGKISRREFIKNASLIVGGVAVGVGSGAASILHGKEKELPELWEMPTSKGVIAVDADKCTGCRSCEVVCSIFHNDIINTELARIRIVKDWREPRSPIAVNFVTATCRQCASPRCAAVCPTNAIVADPETHARVVIEEKCIGCRKCIEACPYTPSRIYFREDRMVAFKCDLCGGDPMCVKICNAGAVKFQTAYTDTI